MRNLLAILVALCVLPAFAASETYSWVDENGVVHYGDSVPPQYAKIERRMLNYQGVTVKTLEAEKTADQLAEERRRYAIEAAKKREIDFRREQDEILLKTYASIDEIEMVRDRRVAAVDGRIKVTAQYVETLREQLDGLRLKASVIQKNTPPGEKAKLPEYLSRDIALMRNTIAEQLETLQSHYLEQAKLRVKFQKDIERFQSLLASR